jgi:nitric-oxide synthase
MDRAQTATHDRSSVCPVMPGPRVTTLHSGRSMEPFRLAGAHPGQPLEVDALVTGARDFYALPEVRELAGPGRWREVEAEIELTGSYEHTKAELLLGAKLAWRNHARCNGRYSWRSLSLIDARDAQTPAEIAERCSEHLVISTNGGKLRPVITVFRPRALGRSGIRILNPQLIRYAGYEDEGRIIGDPLHVELTRQAMKAGWTPGYGQFDILPMMISVDGRAPEIFTVPPEAILEVPISHPRYEWFADLGLRWHANPAISDLCLEIGGLEYTAAPFSGWYVSSEIGARNLSDTARYDQLPKIAERLGLDTRRNASLWKDRALLELNEAVIHSYAQAGVYIVDHHTASEQFVAHVDREHRSGRLVPSDWAWVNPPMSASTTRTFHRDFDPPSFDARPNFVRRAE